MAECSPPDVRVVLANTGRAFGRRWAFRGVTAQVRSGGVLAITGPNGSGKSTLLRVISGLLLPTTGTADVVFGGVHCDAASRRALIGYAAPEAALYGELSGVENLEFFARLRGQRLCRDDLAAALSQVGLLGRGRDRVADYSSGMRHRLKLAAAAICQPALLLLDEPGSNLDAEGLECARGLVERQRTRGITVLATNDPREAAWADEIVRLGGD